jgi:serine/threonine protein kinase
VLGKPYPCLAIPAYVEADVIHGDIKPANILIFRDDLNRCIAKVADFGYSTVGTENGLVYLPKSVPWNAPEHHGRDFTFQRAIKTDTYSFGLVCLRILFEDLLLQHFPKFSEAYEKETFLLGKIRIVEIPATAGYEADLLPFAIDAVKSKVGLELSQKKTLEKFFKVTIAGDPNLRSDDFSELQRLLSNDQ